MCNGLNMYVCIHLLNVCIYTSVCMCIYKHIHTQMSARTCLCNMVCLHAIVSSTVLQLDLKFNDADLLVNKILWLTSKILCSVS